MAQFGQVNSSFKIQANRNNNWPIKCMERMVTVRNELKYFTIYNACHLQFESGQGLWNRCNDVLATFSRLQVHTLVSNLSRWQGTLWPVGREGWPFRNYSRMAIGGDQINWQKFDLINASYVGYRQISRTKREKNHNQNQNRLLIFRIQNHSAKLPSDCYRLLPTGNLLSCQALPCPAFCVGQSARSSARFQRSEYRIRCFSLLGSTWKDVISYVTILYY